MRVTHLILIRHGQASFGQENYDQLSPLGCTQMQRLGSLFPTTTHLKLNLNHTQIHVGHLQRQQDSMKYVLDQFPKLSTSMRETLNQNTLIASALNEFDFQHILKVHQDRLFDEPQSNALVHRGGIHAFHFFIAQWMLGTLSSDDLGGIPTWIQFQQGVVEYLDDLHIRDLSQNSLETQDDDRYHLCFTSAGVITAFIAHVMKMNPIQSLALLMKIKNSSITI